LLLGAEALLLLLDRAGVRVFDGSGLRDIGRLSQSVGPALRVYLVGFVPVMILYLALVALTARVIHSGRTWRMVVVGLAVIPSVFLGLLDLGAIAGTALAITQVIFVVSIPNPYSPVASVNER
jgi:hypothetical protein